MGDTFEYKGYIGSVEYDADADIFHGVVINTKDIITFEGTCVEDLKKSLAESIEEYLAFCAERGEEPDRPFSGKLTLRMKPDLHRRVRIQAKKHNLSINEWINRIIEKEIA